MTEKIRKYTLKQPARPQKQYRVAYEQELNSEQLEVVMAGEGPLLVIAGAGSGKTRTLTYRVSRLIEDGVDPSDIIENYGTDTARWFVLSDSPPARDVIWTEAGVAGAHRFVQRVWRLLNRLGAELPAPGLPFSLVFRAEPGREDIVLRIASAYEAASRRRISPPMFGPLPGG